MAGVMSFFFRRGKLPLITGASRGIGEAIAHGYAEAGARVVLASRKQEEPGRRGRGDRAAGGLCGPGNGGPHR